MQQERLGRSLDRLSKDLYSKDTHFVLELIQNADDNSYDDSLLSNQKDDCPAVKFVIEHDGIYVLNNELGFREKDIKALCDVGRSTKGKHKFGYIGELNHKLYPVGINDENGEIFTYRYDSSLVFYLVQKNINICQKCMYPCFFL